MDKHSSDSNSDEEVVLDSSSEEELVLDSSSEDEVVLEEVAVDSSSDKDVINYRSTGERVHFFDEEDMMPKQVFCPACRQFCGYPVEGFEHDCHPTEKTRYDEDIPEDLVKTANYLCSPDNNILFHCHRLRSNT